MAKLQFSSWILLLLQAVAASELAPKLESPSDYMKLHLCQIANREAVAAPHVSPTGAQPALAVSSPSTFATSTATSNLFHNNLKRINELVHARRAEAFAPMVKKEAAPITTLTLANSFTNLATANSTISNANKTVIATTTAPGTATGVFTGLDGGVYGVTSWSGYVYVDGKTLHSGQSALIGQEYVLDGSEALVANGVTVPLTPVTMSSAPASTAVVMTTSAGGSSMAGSSMTGSSMAASMTSSAAASSASAAASSSKGAAAAVHVQAGTAMVAVVGGLLGLVFW